MRWYWMKEQHATNVFVWIEKMRSLFIIFRTISQVKRFGRNTFVAYLHNVLLLPYNLTLGFSLQLNKYNVFQFWYLKMLYFFTRSINNITNIFFSNLIIISEFEEFVVLTKFIIYTNDMKERGESFFISGA